ncbi:MULTISPECIES: hypothetical protein [Aeromonas]|uniref:hypothetical protein n=1 Tax=Aeromonas TaxID=642 RepID=UPI0005B2F4DD|nr:MULTISPECIES: hypothetical protein [Aeromonas]TNH69823.1 hypothetical protein CF142_14025 [Aeromonas caviae]
MAPKKKVTTTGDDKSQQLAAAAVDQSAELVQAQAEPLQSVALEQAAEAQGVDLVAEQAAKQTEMIAAEEARQALAEPVTEQEINQLATNINLKALGIEKVPQQQDNADWLLGQFDVKAKSPAGFWRCGIQFLHSSATRVFVVTAKADVPHDHSCEIPCCYLTCEEALRVHEDQWLVCTEYEVMGV